MSHAQTETLESNVTSIINTAFQQKRLPIEVLNRSADSNIIAIEGTVENGLQRTYSKPELFQVSILYQEDLFIDDLYWLTPTTLQLNGSSLKFNYQTYTWSEKNTKYYKGLIHAIWNNGDWELKKSRFKETKYIFPKSN